MPMYLVHLYPMKYHSMLPPRRLRGESSTPVQVTTIEIPVLEDVASVPICRGSLSSNASSDSDDENIENIDTRTDARVITLPTIQGEPTQVQEELPSAI